MNHYPNRRATALAIDASIEPRLGSRLAAALTMRSQGLPHDLSERLRVARERAVATAREQHRLAAAPAAVDVSSDGAGILGGFAPWWQRAAAVLPLVLLVAGLVAIDQWSTREQVLAAAEIDTQLLADDLPPDAYRDPGFAEFLRTSPP